MTSSIFVGCEIDAEHEGQIKSWIYQRELPMVIKKAEMDAEEFKLVLNDL
ncbi:MAG: hypothetical protein GY861_10400 [bacterium]|nr:hypothetical protein [bacterium]